MRPDIFIITHDTAQALGLKYLLSKYFNLTATFVSSSNVSQVNESQASLFFVTPQSYIDNIDFFIPRRARTIVIHNTPSNDSQCSINVCSEESELANQLSDIIENISSGNDSSSGELSQREIEVLRLVAMGYINKEIADKLSISFNTVLTHRKNISAKLGIKSVSGLGIYAVMNGHISENDLTR